MTRVIVGVLLAGLLIAPCVFAAADYRSMTEEQLQQQRTTMSTMPPSERQAFSEEWYRRYQRQPLEEQMRMEQKAAGVYGQGSAPAGTYLPGGPGSSSSSMTSESMSQPGGTVTRDRSTTTMERTVPGAAMEQPGMSSQSSTSSGPTGQPGTMMRSSQADMSPSVSAGSAMETYSRTRDYRTMSNEELNRLMRPENSSNLSPAERAEVRREFESRIQTFTPEERQRYLLGSSRDIQQ